MAMVREKENVEKGRRAWTSGERKAFWERMKNSQKRMRLRIVAKNEL